MKYIYIIILYALAVAYNNISTEYKNNTKLLANKSGKAQNRLPASKSEESYTDKLKKCFSN